MANFEVSCQGKNFSKNLLFLRSEWESRLYLGLSQHCREDNRILETMIVTTIVAIVATIKKIAKLAILKAKFKEINHII